jgi:MFS family permease
MQGVGYLVVPVTALMLVTLMGENSDYAWRILLGLGALPGFLLTLLRVRRLPVGKAPCPPKRTIKNADILTPDDVNAEELRSAPVSIIDAILIEPGLSTKLLGTGGCWFLFGRIHDIQLRMSIPPFTDLLYSLQIFCSTVTPFFNQRYFQQPLVLRKPSQKLPEILFLSLVLPFLDILSASRRWANKVPDTFNSKAL